MCIYVGGPNIMNIILAPTLPFGRIIIVYLHGCPAFAATNRATRLAWLTEGGAALRRTLTAVALKYPPSATAARKAIRCGRIPSPLPRLRVGLVFTLPPLPVTHLVVYTRGKIQFNLRLNEDCHRHWIALLTTLDSSLAVQDARSFQQVYRRDLHSLQLSFVYKVYDGGMTTNGCCDGSSSKVVVNCAYPQGNNPSIVVGDTATYTIAVQGFKPMDNSGTFRLAITILRASFVRTAASKDALLSDGCTRPYCRPWGTHASPSIGEERFAYTP